MQTLHLTGINKLLHPERDKRSATERIFDHLSHSNIGLNRGEATADTGSAASALDSSVSYTHLTLPTTNEV